MPVKMGNKNIKNVKLGNQQVSKIMLGDKKVWGKTRPVKIPLLVILYRTLQSTYRILTNVPELIQNTGITWKSGPTETGFIGGLVTSGNIAQSDVVLHIEDIFTSCQGFASNYFDDIIVASIMGKTDDSSMELRNDNILAINTVYFNKLTIKGEVLTAGNFVVLFNWDGKSRFSVYQNKNGTISGYGVEGMQNRLLSNQSHNIFMFNTGATTATITDSNNKNYNIGDITRIENVTLWKPSKCSPTNISAIGIGIDT